MIRVSDLAKDRKTVEVAIDETGDLVVKATIRPSAYTLELAEQLKEAREQQGWLHEVHAMLAAMLVAWDLVDDEGTMYPIDLAHLKKLPAAFLVNVLDALIKASRTGVEAEDRKNSAGTSRAKAKRGRQRTGTTPSR